MSEMDGILEQFAVEPVHDRGTLERYLRRWPQYATALIDLSREIARPIDAAPEEIPAADLDRFQQMFASRRARAAKAVVDPFQALSRDQRQALPKLLGVPAMVMLAFRERRIILATVPLAFARRFAAAIGLEVDALLSGLALPRTSAARVYKSDVKPTIAEQVSFEQILIDAQVPANERAALLEPEA